MAAKIESANAITAWNKREFKDFNEAPLLFRIAGIVIISVTTALALI